MSSARSQSDEDQESCNQEDDEISQNSADLQIQLEKEMEMKLKVARRSSKRLLQGVNEVLGDIQLVHGEFVKTSMIRQVVVDLILPFKTQYDQLGVEQRAFKTQQLIHTKAITKAQNDASKALYGLEQIPDINRHINQVEKQLVQLEKHTKFKFDEVHVRFTEVLHKFKQHENEFKDHKKMINETNDRFKSLHKTIDNVRDRMQKDMSNFVNNINSKMGSNKEVVDQYSTKIRSFENLFKDLSKSVDVSVTRAIIKIETHHREEMSKFLPCLDAIERTNTLTNLISYWEPRIEQLMNHLHASENVNIFLERHLPFLQHFQLCEAIREVTGSRFHDDLRAFEIKKLNQLYQYDHKCKGFKPNIEGLSQRIDLYVDHFKKEGKGIPPFVLGRDYAPYMPIEDNMFLDKACLIQFENYNLKIFNERKNLDRIKRLCERIADQTPEEETVILYLLKQLKDHQIQELQKWVYDQRLNAGDFDSVILDYEGREIESQTKEQKQAAQLEKDLQEQSSQNSDYYDQHQTPPRVQQQPSWASQNSKISPGPKAKGNLKTPNQSMSPKKQNQVQFVQANQNYTQHFQMEKVQNRGGQGQISGSASPSRGKDMISKLSNKIDNKVQSRMMSNMLQTTKMHSEQANQAAHMAEEGLRMTQQILQQQNNHNYQHHHNQKNPQKQTKQRGRRGGAQQHQCEYDADEVQRMINEGIETAVEEFKTSAKINNFPKQMYLVHTVPQKRMLQHKIRSKKHLNQKTNKELKSIRKALYDFENMLPQSVVEYTKSQKKGIDINFGKIADEIDAEEDKKLLEGIYERIHKENEKFDSRKQSDIEVALNDHRMKRDQQEDYKNQVKNSYKKKIKNGAIKIKEALSVPQQKEIKRKALLEARPNIITEDRDDDGDINFEMGFTKDQARYIQNIVDKSIDWLRLFVKLNIETKTEDAKNEQNIYMQDLKKYTEENVVQLFKQQVESLKQVQEIHASSINLIKDLEEMQAQNKEDRINIQQFKQKLMADVKLNSEKCNMKMDTFQTSLNTLVETANRNHEVLSQIIEVNMIESLVQAQDYQDKKELNLLGMQTNKQIFDGMPTNDDNKKTYFLQKDQLMHEGSYAANSTLKQLKMACLSYQQTPIDYKGIKLAGEELLKMKDNLLVECQDIFSKIPINEYITDQMLAVNPTEGEKPKMLPSSMNVSMSTFDNGGEKLDSKITHNKSDKKNASRTLTPGLKHKSQAKVGLDSKNQFNIKSIFKNQANLNNNQSQRQSRYMAQKKPTISFVKDQSSKMMDQVSRFDRKSQHLRNRSKAQNQLSILSKQDIVKQWVDNDLEFFLDKNYTTYDAKSNSVMGVIEKKMLIRHPTPPDMEGITTEKDQTFSDAERVIENDKLTYAQIAVQYREGAGALTTQQMNHKKAVDFRTLKQMHTKIDSSHNMQVRAHKLNPVQHPHQAIMNSLKSQGVMKIDNLVLNNQRSKTPTAANMQRMFLMKQKENQQRAGKDLMDIVSQGDATQLTTKQGSRIVGKSFIDSSHQSPSALEEFSSSIMTGFVQGPLDLNQNNNQKESASQFNKFRSQMQPYDPQKSYISDDPNSLISEPKSPLPNGISIQVAKQSPLQLKDECDISVYSQVRQVRQNYQQASSKLFPKKVAKGPALRTVNHSLISNKDEIRLIVKE